MCTPIPAMYASLDLLVLACKIPECRTQVSRDLCASLAITLDYFSLYVFSSSYVCNSCVCACDWVCLHFPCFCLRHSLDEDCIQTSLRFMSMYHLQETRAVCLLCCALEALFVGNKHMLVHVVRATRKLMGRMWSSFGGGTLIDGIHP
jgi:hypothetical protein